MKVSKSEDVEWLGEQLFQFCLKIGDSYCRQSVRSFREVQPNTLGYGVAQVVLRKLRERGYVWEGGVVLRK